MEIRPVNQVIPLLAAATAPGTGEVFNVAAFHKVIEATLTGAGATATVRIFGNTRNNSIDGILLATITLASATPRDGFAFDAVWPYLYAEVVTITGGGSLDVDLAV
jgi:hypothetical protein